MGTEKRPDDGTLVLDPASANRAFPVVAIGASAGGLTPTIEVLRNLGGAPGLAVVVIPHLDPSHESGLVQILSR